MMPQIPNPLGNSFEISSLAETEELFKIAIIGIIVTGVLIFWLGKKVKELGSVENEKN